MAIFDSIENVHFFKVKNTIDSLLFCTWLMLKNINGLLIINNIKVGLVEVLVSCLQF